MPSDVVLIDLSTATAAVPQETYNDVLIFAQATKQNEPDIGFNTPEEYRDSAQVANDFGENSDAHIASQQLESEGTKEWHVVCLEETEHTEVVAQSDKNSVNQGKVSNTPVTGNFEVEVTLDGKPQDVTPVAVAPPGSNNSPSSGEAFFNYDTGQVVTGDKSSGKGTGIEVTYHTTSFSDAFGNIPSDKFDLAFLANRHLDVADIGDADELITWGAGNYTFIVGATQNGNNYSDDDAFRRAAQKVSSYLVSSDFAMWAHKSADDVAAAVTGWLAIHRPWSDPTFAQIGVQSDNIRLSEVGAPGETETFEGGNQNGVGPMNVLVHRQGTLVSSNDLTTAGAGSNYRYLDVRRTEGFVIGEAEDALVGLALRKADVGIPFNKEGQTMIDNTLTQTLSQYEYAQGPYTDLDIVVPPATTLTQEQRANRIWGDIEISFRLNGNVHRFKVRIAARA